MPVKKSDPEGVVMARNLVVSSIVAILIMVMVIPVVTSGLRSWVTGEGTVTTPQEQTMLEIGSGIDPAFQQVDDFDTGIGGYNDRWICDGMGPYQDGTDGIVLDNIYFTTNDHNTQCFGQFRSLHMFSYTKGEIDDTVKTFHWSINYTPISDIDYLEVQISFIAWEDLDSNGRIHDSTEIITQFAMVEPVIIPVVSDTGYNVTIDATKLQKIRQIESFNEEAEVMILFLINEYCFDDQCFQEQDPRPSTYEIELSFIESVIPSGLGSEDMALLPMTIIIVVLFMMTYYALPNKRFRDDAEEIMGSDLDGDGKIGQKKIDKRRKK